MTPPSFNSLKGKISRTWLWTGGIAIIVVAAILYFAFGRKGSPYQFVTVAQGPITETVEVTGNTTPMTSVDLGFPNGGTIASVNKLLGSHVNAGDVLESLDTATLRAQLSQAQANADAAKAQLANLEAGAQPADIQASQAALAGGQQSLANLYGNAANILNDSYAKANDAVRNQLAAFFSNAETSVPQLTFSVSNSQAVNNAVSARVSASTELNTWQTEVASLSPASPTSTLDAALLHGAAHLSAIKTFLAAASQALLQETGISSGTLATYNTALTAASAEVNTASTNVNTEIQNLASQKITIQQLQAQLDLKLAGATAQQIQNQEAQVEAAQANVASVQAQLDQAILTAPVSGTITVQNAKVGEIASPGETLTSIISDSGFEVDSNVPETDIGKINVGDPVSMTFDAFPNKTFTGKVFYIDPAQTLQNGVVDYLVKVSFDHPDASIKSGLTANLDIETETHPQALILPQYAVIQNDSGTFVEVLKGGVVAQVPVTLGLQDASGNVEIASGVTAGEQVINIGLK